MCRCSFLGKTFMRIDVRCRCQKWGFHCRCCAPACGCVLQRAGKWHTPRGFWCVSNAKMLHFACNNNFEGDHQRSVEFVLFFLTSLRLMIKIRVYIHTEVWTLLQVVSEPCSSCLLCGPEVRNYFPSFLFFSFLFSFFLACELRSEHCCFLSLR